MLQHNNNFFFPLPCGIKRSYNRHSPAMPVMSANVINANSNERGNPETFAVYCSSLKAALEAVGAVLGMVLRLISALLGKCQESSSVYCCKCAGVFLCFILSYSQLCISVVFICSFPCYQRSLVVLV